MTATCAAASSSAVWYFISPQTTASTPAATSAGARLAAEPVAVTTRRTAASGTPHPRRAPEDRHAAGRQARQGLGFAVVVGHLADLPVALAPRALQRLGEAQRELEPQHAGQHPGRRRAHIERRVEIHERHLVADGGPHHGPGAFQGARLGSEGVGSLEERRMMGEEHVGPGLSGSGHSTRRGVQGHGHPGHGQRALPHQKPGAVPLLGILGRELLNQRAFSQGAMVMLNVR